MRCTLVWRIFFVGLLTLALALGSVVGIVGHIVTNVVYREIDTLVLVAQNTSWEAVRNAGTPASAGGRLHLGPHTVNGDNALVDHVKSLTSADATLFELLDGKPIRVSTTIRNPDGSRNIGSELLGPARRAIDAGKSFVGISPVGDRSFISRYDFLRDANGNDVGVLASEIPLVLRDVAAARIMRAVFTSTLVALIICLGVLFFVTRPLFTLLPQTIAIARGLAAGDVDQRAGVISNDEIGDLNAAFGQMIAYQQRMATVADAIADGDLTIEIAPVSESDRLGVAFTRMLGNVRNYITQLETLPLTDALTQVGNVRSFEQEIRFQLSAAARYGQLISLVVVDVDNLAALNDVQGRQRGDAVLAGVGKLLKTLRGHDRPYRLGGDRFVLILPQTPGAGARIAMERLREKAPGQLFGATLTFGIATTADGRISPQELQTQAEHALQSGKQNGRNTVVLFEPPSFDAADTGAAENAAAR